MVNSQVVLTKWLNSHEYHRDEDKLELIEEIHKVFPENALKFVFIMLLSNKALAINNIGSFINLIMGKQGELQFEVQK